MRHALLCSAALLAFAGPAFAQTEVAETASVDPTPAVDAELDSEVIVVTAQGRSQQLADVPIAISAVSSEQLQNSGANDIRELNQLAPSLLVSSTGNESNGSARIRGIGTVGDNPGLESSVALFIDGVYRSRTGNGLSDLGPIDRVEVLRGPQGTLGGRNSSAGLLNIFTEAPSDIFEGYGAATYGNYDHYRFEGGVNVPLGERIAARVDGLYSKRDGFYRDVVNDTDVNNRDRYLIRGQIAADPTDTLSLRLIADYSSKDEACCAATFLPASEAPLARVSPALDQFDPNVAGQPGLTSTGNPIIPVLLGLGQNPAALGDDIYDRNIYVTPGRSYEGETEDYGISLQADLDLGNINLTSITAYRQFENTQGMDADYTQIDILHRNPGPDAGSRRFKTFSQELRLNGTLFDNRLDWLIGGYYAQEDLLVRDNLSFGDQYGQFAQCRLALGLNDSLSPFAGGSVVSPGSARCLTPTGNAILGSGAVFGAATPSILAGIDRLNGIGGLGDSDTRYMQDSENFAIFTHNIVHLTDKLDLTLGARYTHEQKDFSAEFNNSNTVCAANREALGPLLATGAGAFAGGIIGLSCVGNSTSELNDYDLTDSRTENEVTGTAILSYKPVDDLLLYASYSRGYKAGGFNLDRSALVDSTIFSLANPASNFSVSNLQFDQEEVDAVEVGAKYAARDFSVSVSAFYQRFSNFQLNTFNGTVFLVQNINSCGNDLAGGDMDGSAATGSCTADDVEAGVVSRGIELEATMRPTSTVDVSAGLTLTDAEYKDDLIGSDNGEPLDPALRLLPGQDLSNAPNYVATASFAWTPPLGDSGLSGLFYLNGRLTGDFNTGSDLLPAKTQDGFFIANARIGIRGPDDRWAIEGWAQNLFDTDYTQVAFNTPVVAPQQTFSAYLAEPRTYGVTVRGRF
ncbi:TonB-dependent receptor [Pacificimonas sp. ICDLI1SI03]